MKNLTSFIFLGLVFFSCNNSEKQRKNAESLSGSSASPPNIIFILTDDQGWTGTSLRMDPDDPESRSDFIETPNIERLAKQGMRFSRAYCPAAICSPSRCALQYGKSPARLLFMSNEFEKGQWNPGAKERISQSVSIPKMLKQSGQGYVTAHLGRWHHWPHPDSVGYDLTTGASSNTEGNFLKGPDRKTKTPGIRLPEDDPKRIFSLSRKACEFMDKQVMDKKPFYLQISHYAAHANYYARPETLEKYENKEPGKWHNRTKFGAMIEDLDDGIGIVLDKIKELGIEDNTYIFLIVDNGAVTKGRGAARVNIPLRRGKYGFMEGGIRVPMLVAGPSIPKNSHSEVLVWGCDLWPTFHDLAGSKVPIPNDLDGGSLVSLLKAGGEGDILRSGMPEGLIFHCAQGEGGYAQQRQSAIRYGDFKLIKHYYNNDEVLLFNVRNDPYEWHDLSEELPDKYLELLTKMEGYLERVDAVDAAMTKEQLDKLYNAEYTVFPIESFSEEEKDPKPYKFR